MHHFKPMEVFQGADEYVSKWRIGPTPKLEDVLQNEQEIRSDVHSGIMEMCFTVDPFCFALCIRQSFLIQ